MTRPSSVQPESQPVNATEEGRSAAPCEIKASSVVGASPSAATGEEPDEIADALKALIREGAPWQHATASLTRVYSAIAALRSERDAATRRIAEVERACDMPLDMIATALDAHRNTAEEDHRLARRFERYLHLMAKITHAQRDRCRAATRRAEEAEARIAEMKNQQASRSSEDGRCGCCGAWVSNCECRA